VETDANANTRETKEQMERDYIRNDTNKLKIKNCTSCIQDRNKWKLHDEKAKTFKD